MAQDMSQGAAWMHGEIIPIQKATIGVTDWGLTHADCVYDVVPVWNGAFFRLGDYMQRFITSVSDARMDIGLNAEDIREILHDIVAASGLRSAYVSFVAARGSPLVHGVRDPRACQNHFYAWCVPYVHVIKPELADAGVQVWLSSETRRIPEDSLNPRAKNYHWGDFTRGLFEAKDRGFETVLLPDHHGNVTEGPGFNIFALHENRIVTPERGVLHGITRQTVLELCQEQGFHVEERELPITELLDADEVFLSSSGGGVIPVSRINDRHFSNSNAGPVGMRLRRLYFERLDDPNYRSEIEYS